MSMPALTAEISAYASPNRFHAFVAGAPALAGGLTLQQLTPQAHCGGYTDSQCSAICKSGGWPCYVCTSDSCVCCANSFWCWWGTGSWGKC
ncbi:MAG: hypothetical protein LC808_01660 [Actinobacteria bacterium]|nr:hypothetical protein [Actinomycetota bacterium]